MYEKRLHGNHEGKITKLEKGCRKTGKSRTRANVDDEKTKFKRNVTIPPNAHCVVDSKHVAKRTIHNMGRHPESFEILL